MTDCGQSLALSQLEQDVQRMSALTKESYKVQGRAFLKAYLTHLSAKPLQTKMVTSGELYESAILQIQPVRCTLLSAGGLSIAPGSIAGKTNFRIS